MTGILHSYWLQTGQPPWKVALSSQPLCLSAHGRVTELSPLISSSLLHNHKLPVAPRMSRRMMELLQSPGFNELQVLLHDATLLEKKLEEEDDCSSDHVVTAQPSR
jgi:hypothetical protein